MGASENDWLELGAIPGLSNKAVALAEDAGDQAESAFGDFQKEAHSALEVPGLSGEWTRILLSDPNFASLWPPLGEGSLDEFYNQGKDRVSAMEERLSKLKAELREHEKSQRKIVEQLQQNQRLLEEKDRALEKLKRELERRPPTALPSAFGDVREEQGLRTPAPTPAPAVQKSVVEEPPEQQAQALPEPVFEPEPPPAPQSAFGDVREEQGQRTPPPPPPPPVMEEPAQAQAPEAPPSLPPVVEPPPPALPSAFGDVREEQSQRTPPPEPVAPPPAFVNPQVTQGYAQEMPSPAPAGPPPTEGYAEEAPPLEAVGPQDAAQLTQPPQTIGQGAPVDDQVWDFAPELTPLKAATDLPPALEFEAPRTVFFSSSADGSLDMAQGVPAFQPAPFGSPEETQKYPTVIPAADEGAGFQAAAEQPAGVPVFMPSSGEPAINEPPAAFFPGAPDAPGQDQGIPFSQPSDAVVIPGFGGEPGDPQSPADLFAGGTQTPIPMTAQSPIGQPDMPSNLWTNSPQVTEIPAARPFDELFATHPTPVPSAMRAAVETPAPETKPKKRLQSKGFLIVLGSSVGVLAMVAFFFLRNPKDLATIFNMGPQKKGPPAAETAAATPAGQTQPAGPGPRQAAQAQTAQSQPAEPAAGQASPAPAQAPKPQAPSPDFIPNENIRAVEFVKDYKLDKEHGTISQWLQYSFQSTAENTAAWSAGAISSTIYVVTYRVSTGGKLKYTYNFEVDLAQKTVVGKNPDAMSLLNSGKPIAAKPPAAPALRPQAKAAKSPKAAAKPAKSPKAVTKAEDEPAPLPDETELEPPRRQGGGGFNNPGADTVTLSP